MTFDLSKVAKEWLSQLLHNGIFCGNCNIQSKNCQRKITVHNLRVFRSRVREQLRTRLRSSSRVCLLTLYFHLLQ